MELVKQLKKLKLDITWESSDEGVIGKSLPIVRYPFKFEEELLIVEGDNDIFFRFTCDDNNYFWIPISDKENFIHLFKIYTKKYHTPYEDPKLRSPDILPLPYENTIYYYGGLCPNIDKLETKYLFNKYLCRTFKTYKTAYWLSEQTRHTRTYHTMFSNSIITFELLTKFSVQLDTKNDTKKFHPLFIKINYPTTKHNTSRYKIMGNSMLYDVLNNEMPYDIWAALQQENVFDKVKIIGMINGMSEDLKNEKDYLNFVLAAVNELNGNTQ